MEEKQIPMTIEEIVYLNDLIDTCVDDEIDFPTEIYDIKEKLMKSIEEARHA